MNKKIVIAIISAVCVVAIGLSIAALAVVCVKGSDVPAQQQIDEQYVVYLGTNDKDTNLPVFDRAVAKEKAIEILLEHFGGYTIQEADGGWVDGETTYTEFTLVIYLSDTTSDKVHAAADEMLQVFHQSSVLIQANRTVTEFYSGGTGNGAIS